MRELLPSGRSDGYEICDDAVDMSNNGKVTNIFLVRHHLFPSLWLWILRLIRSPVVWTICSRDW